MWVPAVGRDERERDVSRMNPKHRRTIHVCNFPPPSRSLSRTTSPSDRPRAVLTRRFGFRYSPTDDRNVWTGAARMQERSWASRTRSLPTLPASTCATALLPSLGSCRLYGRAHRLTTLLSRRVIKTLTGQHLNVRCGADSTVRDLKGAVAAQAVRPARGCVCASRAPPTPSHRGIKCNAGLGCRHAAPHLRREAAG